MRKSSISNITYGAIICALVGVLLLVNRQLAKAIDLYLFWIIPLPIIIYSVLFNSKQAVVMSISMLLLSVIITGFDLSTLMYVFASIMAGLVYGYGLNKGKNAYFLIGSVIVISLLVSFFSMFVFSAFFGYDINADIALLQELLTKSMPTAAVNGIALDSNMILKLLVIGTILGCVLEGILVHLLAYIVLKRLKLTLPPMKSVSEIYAPIWARIIVFAAYFAVIVSYFTSISQYNDILILLVSMADVICFAFGYIFALTILNIYVGDRKKVMLLIGIILLISFIYGKILVYLGLFDMFTNIRATLLERYKNDVQSKG